ncbi:hypothetical protein Hypma_002029 [Hypsizygus marmoreus]|uniref:Uncharacterized protein n=1 Tax=Hypsizygus marmoreus TaxID=39966 RepID=A0A369J4S8_HYPMA|nr:hypothetical protein Hypma_002029 [Hypsizygus marmoreus]
MLQAQVMAKFVKANSIPSILLLDGMWTLFNDSVGTLIGTNNGKWSKTVKDTMIIQTLGSLIARHPFWKQDTSAYRVLYLLNDTRIAWDAVYANALDHRITSSHPPVQHLPLQLSYNTKKTLMKAFSQSPLTDIGFWNVLIHRAIFYGSEFTKIQEANFSSFDDWHQHRSASEKPDTYFINFNAYGTANKNSNLEAIETLWKQRYLWAPFIQTNPGPVEVYEFLVYLNCFRNVGPLTAMLLTGDLCKAGVIRQPTIEELGALV